MIFVVGLIPNSVALQVFVGCDGATIVFLMTPTPPEISRLGYWSGYLLLVLAAFGLFVDLGGLTLRQWDEARLAVSALEMSKSGNWVVTTFGGVPDLWNTKPPLMIWLQAGFIRLLGPTEWVIRLPAALAALATIVAVYYFMRRFLHRPVGGLLAGLVLISSLAFLGEHHGHTGDYDALLTLAEFILGASLILLLETAQRRWFVGVFFGLLVGALTKGVAVMLPLLGVGVYCLATPRGRRLLRMPQLWLVGLSWLACVAGWYILREQQAPGYWAAVNLNELGGRFNTALEAHHAPWYFYLDRMASSKFLPWMYLLPLVLPFALTHPDARARRAAQFALAWVVGLLVVLSIAKTKIEWYAVPAFPWLAILIGLGGPRLATFLLGRSLVGVPRMALRALFVAFLLVPPIITIHHELRGNWRDPFPDTRAGYGLRELQQAPSPPTPLTVIAPAGFRTSLRPITAVGGKKGYNASLRFYILAYPREIQVASPADIPTLPKYGYVLTSTPQDSALVRITFPQAFSRAVGRRTCWLWTL